MATRYWVGGSGNWTDTARWSTTSGGAGGASVPTISDDVIVNGSSGSPTITLTANQECQSLNTTGATCTFGSSTTTTRELLIYGNITLGSTTTFRSSNGARPRIKATSTVSISNAKLDRDIYFDAAGATFTVSGALTIGSSFESFSGIFRKDIFVEAGTFTTNNNSITAYNFYGRGDSTTYNFGSSTFNLIADFTIDSTATLNAGTSTINCTYGGDFNGGGKTYNTVNLTYNNDTAISLRTGSITGTNTFTTLNISNQVSLTNLTVESQTITGTFTASSNSSIKRLRILTSNFTTQATITAGTTSLSYVDFRSIIGAGAAAWTGTSVGNIGNNSGITFTAAVSRYAKAASTNNYFVNIGWAATSGGASGASVPLPQDTVYFNATAGAGTYYASGLICQTLDFTGFAQTINSSLTSAIEVYGNITLPPVGVLGGTTQLDVIALGSGSHTITALGGEISELIIGSTINSTVGTYTLSGNVDVFSFEINSGTFSAGANNVTVQQVSAISVIPKTINMGSGTWTLDGSSTSWNTSGANTTLNKETANIVINSTDTGISFTGGGLTYPKITLAGSTDNQIVFFSGDNFIDELSSTSTGQFAMRFDANSTTTFGAFTVTGTGSAKKATIYSSSTSEKATLIKDTPWYVGVNSTSTRSSGINLVAGDGIDYLVFQDISALPQASSFLIMF